MFIKQIIYLILSVPGTVFAISESNFTCLVRERITVVKTVYTLDVVVVDL
jgi:hypothetical protein